MRADPSILDLLAELLSYPRAGHAERMSGIVGEVARSSPSVALHLASIGRFAQERSLGECEELYVFTFDANAERALEVGWQVFGEQYERGAFLVDLRGRMRAVGVAETTELPDHLTQVLRLLGRVEEDEARTLVDRAVVRSLARVRGNVEAGDAYAGVLDAISKALLRLGPATADASPASRTSSLQSPASSLSPASRTTP